MSSLLVADIGGTNARFGLVDIAGTQQATPDFSAQAQLTLRCADYPNIADMIRDYVDQQTVPMPEYACLAIAGPIADGRVRMTNLQWEFSIAGLQQDLGMQALDIINDFAALAYSMPHLKGPDLHELHRGQPDTDAPMLALGPGTGFGMAALVPFGRQWKIVPTEGGHCNFAPGTDEELAILQTLLRRQPHVSIENLISGNGLVALYEALAAVRGEKAENLTAADINDGAQNNTDVLCRSALETFCNILGSVTGDKVLSLGARGGVCLGGGIVPRLLDFIPQTKMLERYTQKGPMQGYIEPVPLNVVVKKNAALVGTAAWLVDNTPALRQP